MNLAELRAYTRELAGLHVAALVPDTRVDAALNEAYWEVLTAEVWPWSVSAEVYAVSAGGSSVQLPVTDAAVAGGSPMQRVMAVDVFDGADWRRLEGRTFTPEWPVDVALVESGDVQQWTVTVDAATGVSKVAFDNAFEEPVTVRVWLVGPLARGGSPVSYGLVAGGDVPEFGSEFHPMLAYRAAAKLLTQENDDTPRPSLFMSEYSAFLQRMRSRYLTRGLDPIVMGSRRRVRSTRYLGWGA